MNSEKETTESEVLTLYGYRARVANGFLQRARGLIGKKSLGEKEALLIPRCNAIHTFFMKFDIDAMFLDKNLRIVKRVCAIRPWRPFVFGGFKAVMVLEVASPKGKMKREEVPQA